MGARRETLVRGVQERGANAETGTHTEVMIKMAETKQQLGEGLFATCSFSDLGLDPALCQHLQDTMGFHFPTKVQEKAIPVVISGRHILVNAATGTGKTIAYLAPIVHLLQMHDPRLQRSDGTFALVLVPTRELCMQVYEILQKLLKRFHWIVPGYIMGGENRSKEKARLRKGISILIATPGRLLDHLRNTTAFTYSKLQWIVFDEADRILELGYGTAIEEMLDFFNSRDNVVPDNEKKVKRSIGLTKRQNLLLSATLNEKVNHLANISLDNPVMIGLDTKTHPEIKPLTCKIGSSFSNENYDSGQSIGYNLPEQLVQKYVKVPCGSRLAVLLSLLRTLFERDVYQKIVVFFSTCDTVAFHYSLLCQFCWSPTINNGEKHGPFVTCKAFRLHGNMEHDDRRSSFQQFKTEKSALLLCTDVAARGLDFPKVRCIIQYDSPGESTEYVHRVGRTARLGEKGEAVLFLQPAEIDYLNDLQKHGVLLKEYLLKNILDGLYKYFQKHPKSMPSLDMHPWVLTLQRELESFIHSEAELKNLAKEAFCSWVRAYTAHRGELKRFFMVRKLHLGHVARSFGLREQPSVVGGSFQSQMKKRKRNQKMNRPAKRKQITKNPRIST